MRWIAALFVLAILTVGIWFVLQARVADPPPGSAPPAATADSEPDRQAIPLAGEHALSCSRPIRGAPGGVLPVRVAAEDREIELAVVVEDP